MMITFQIVNVADQNVYLNFKLSCNGHITLKDINVNSDNGVNHKLNKDLGAHVEDYAWMQPPLPVMNK